MEQFRIDRRVIAGQDPECFEVGDSRAHRRDADPDALGKSPERLASIRLQSLEQFYVGRVHVHDGRNRLPSTLKLYKCKPEAG